MYNNIWIIKIYINVQNIHIVNLKQKNIYLDNNGNVDKYTLRYVYKHDKQVMFF